MNKQTKAEQLFGKRSKDLNEEELREYYKLLQRERRKRPDVQEYIKRISKEYQKNNREKINQAKREWNRKNPDKIKKYRNASFKREIAVLEKALELACERVKYFEEMQDREMGHFEFFGYDNEYDLQAIIEQYKERAKEELKSE